MGKKRADVWKGFRLSEDGKVATCKECDSRLVSYGKAGTSHAIRHKRTCPGRQNGATPPPGASNLGEGTAVLARQDGAQPPIASPPTIPAAPESSSCSKAANWEEAATADLARMIALHGYDPSFVEDSYFRSFVCQLNPDFQVPSRADIEDICERVFDEANEDLEFELEWGSGKVNLAIDTAETAAGKVLYAASHFIDEDWNRRTIILDVNMVVPEGMELIPYFAPVYVVPENEVDNCDLVESTNAVSNLLISQRVFSVAAGNINHLIKASKGVRYKTAYNHDDALQLVGRCFDRNFDDDFLQELRHGYQTPSDFIETRQERGEFYSQFALDHLLPYEKSWISSYFWLEFVHKTEKREAVSSTLSKSQELVRNVFAAIYRASKTISDPNRPTSNIVLLELFKVRETLQSLLADASGDEAGLYVETIFDEDVVDVLREAEEILDRSIKKEYLRCSIPLVLDPRYKLKHMQILFIRAFSSEAREYIVNIRKEIKEVLTSFSVDDGETSDAELDWYLEDPLVKDNDDFDILNWWKLNSSKYPTLARMARAALAMPTSSKLSSEQMSQITSVIRGYSKRNYE